MKPGIFWTLAISLLTNVSLFAQTDNDDDDAPALTPAGALVLDAGSGKPAVGSLPVDFVRSADASGPDGQGRYLVAVNSGYGLQFSGASNRGEQSLAVIDLNAKPAPAVVQNVYFPAPQSANVGACFSAPGEDGSATLFVSGGFENKVWRFRFVPGAEKPISPAGERKVDAPSIDLTSISSAPPNKRYNRGKAPVYPTGLAMSNGVLFVANNLDDSLCAIDQLEGTPRLTRIPLKRAETENVYPYGAVAFADAEPGSSKVYVSLWNSASLAVIRWPQLAEKSIKFIPTGSHPTAMILSADHARLYVANSNADSVSVIDTVTDREIERIDARLAEKSPAGVSPEGLALSPDGGTLFVANAQAACVAAIHLGNPGEGIASKVVGLIPTGRYPSALAVVGGTVFVGNGKGTGASNSSNDADLSGRNPNAPNRDFPASGKGHHEGRGGAYSVALVAGNLLSVPLPSGETLARYTAQVLRENGLASEEYSPPVFAHRKGGSPFKHVIYVIRENRTYDQVFGDLAKSGDGQAADGDPALAIFGAGEAARRPGGSAQDVTPNAHALALRFGLLDRFFVNSEASADGHNWSTAAYSTDYTDKAFRWNYSGRGRSYDFEGFNRLPDTGQTGGEPLFDANLSVGAMADFFKRYLPYTHGGHDVAEPATRYLWDLAARAGLTYRNYGEFVGTASANDLASARERHAKTYPDVSPTVVAVPAKASLEGHVNEAVRSFDLDTPDAMTVDSFRAALAGGPAPLIASFRAEPNLKGASRLGDWLAEFNRFKNDLAAGKGDALPALSILRLSNDHTAGMAAGKPSPQFYVADNDYALGRLVEEVSHSDFWKNTAIVAVEDDAQDGADHVDCHRSVALVISAYNRPGALIHRWRTTAGLVHTIEEMLGMPPMNAKDSAAPAIDVFRDAPPDLKPYVAALPRLDPKGLLTPKPEMASDPVEAEAIRRSEKLDLAHEDANDPALLNAAIWTSVRGPADEQPAPKHLASFDVQTGGGDADD